MSREREKKERKKERKRKEDVLKREGFWRRGLQFHNCDAFVSETRIKQHPWNNVTHHWEEDLVSTGKNIALCNNVTSCSFKSAPSSTLPLSSAPLTTAKRRVKAVKQILTDTAPCPYSPILHEFVLTAISISIHGRKFPVENVPSARTPLPFQNFTSFRGLDVFKF